MAATDQPQAPSGGEMLTGLLSSLLVLLIAALCILPFDHKTFVDWVGTAFMAATPVQIVLGLLWHNNKPDHIGQLAQPVKGIALTALTCLVGAAVFATVMLLVGRGHGPTPMVVQYFIMSIVVIIWMLPIWQCWPLTLFSKDPLVFGVLTLVFSYLLAYLLWYVFFDYSLLAQIGHPHYYPELDPGGLLNMWTATTFFVTVAGLIVVHFLFDLWPIEKLTGKTAQPLRGIIASVYLLVLAWIVRTVFVDGLQMEPVEYMVRVPVCLIFGTFLVNNMMQFSLFNQQVQPIKGCLLLVCAVLVGAVMYEVYSWASALHAGQALGTGPAAGYAQEIWIASAMLGVTFPIIFLVSGFFGFWPLVRR